MKIEISAQQAVELFPVQVAEIIDQLRKGKSIQKNASCLDLKYTVEWAERIETHTLPELLQGKRSPRPPDDWEGYLEHLSTRIVGFTLHGSIKRWWGYSKTRITGMLPEVVEFYRAAFDKEKAEKARWAALKPDEQKAEFNNALQVLSKSPGFFGFGPIGGDDGKA